MNELLAQIYGTDNIAGHEKTAEAAMLEELEKVAAAEGIDLDELSDEDIVEILAGVMDNEAAAGDDAVEKTAEEWAEEGYYTDENEKTAAEEAEHEKLAEADFLGRTMAHAFYQELHSIGEDGEKTASAELDDAVVARANEILEAASSVLDESEKTSSDHGEKMSKEEYMRMMMEKKKKGKGKDKEASDEESLNAAALEALDAEGYDVDKIVDLLS